MAITLFTNGADEPNRWNGSRRSGRGAIIITEAEIEGWGENILKYLKSDAEVALN